MIGFLSETFFIHAVLRWIPFGGHNTEDLNKHIAEGDVFPVLEELLMSARVRKNSIHLIVIALLVMLGIGMAMLSAAAPAFAADQAALDVYYDDVCLKSFSMSELQSIAQAEGSKKYTFSGSVYFNRMKERGLYSIDRAEIGKRVGEAGLTDIYNRF